MDVLRGRGYGGGQIFQIDESLVRDMSFVREGSFRETEGEPVLRLVGQVQPVLGVTAGPAMPVAIHFSDLVRAFLADSALPPSEARLYLAEAAHQPSPNVPIHFFRERAGLTADDAVALLDSVNTPFPAIRRRLVSRLSGRDLITPSGVISPVSDMPGTAEALRVRLASAPTREQRSVLLEALGTSPALVDDSTADTHLSRLCEAALHLTLPALGRTRRQLFDLFLSVFARRFDLLTSSEKSAFRKAVAYLDQALHASPVGSEG
jgi:hypothetical protein